MCNHRIVGDFYRGCGHFHGRYFTGECVDCESPTCRTSRAHKHRPNQNCNCLEVITEDRKIQNMFQVKFPECRLPPA